MTSTYQAIQAILNGHAFLVIHEPSDKLPLASCGKRKASQGQAALPGASFSTGTTLAPFASKGFHGICWD
jgi:hypothetical protein